MENQHLVVHFYHQSPRIEVYDRRIDFHWLQSDNCDLRVNDYLAHENHVSARLRTGTGLEMIATWELAEDSPELAVQLNPEQETSFEQFLFPAPFLAASGFLVVPHSQGVLYDVDDVPLQQFLDGQTLDAYTSDLSMPWFGVVSMPSGHGCMTILDTPDDAGIHFSRIETEELSILAAQPCWRASKGRMGYPRRYLYWFHIEGGYVSQAKCYMAYVRERGHIPTLAEKEEQRPDSSILRGACHINIHIGNLTFSDTESICRLLKSESVENAVVHIRNWQENPYSSPRHWPPSEIAGGEAGLSGLFEALREIDYIPSLVTGFRDTYSGFEGYAQDDLALDQSGNPQYSGYWGISKIPSQRICGNRQPQVAEAHLEPLTGAADCLLLEHSCLDARECFDTRHPATRGEDIAGRQEVFQSVLNSGRILGVEGAMDFAAPHADFIAGQMSLARFYFIEQAPAPNRFNLSAALRVPLFNLVYHECVHVTWHHQDTYISAEDNGTRALFDLLYGNPPAVTFTHPGTVELMGSRLGQLCETVSSVHSKVAGEELLFHGWLTEDRLVQISRFASGLQIVANFSREPYALPNDGQVAAGSCQAIMPQDE